MSALGIIATELNSIGVPYEFMRWTSAVEDTYFIGEYSETPTMTEDGYREITLMVTGTTIGSWMDLERYRAKIEHHFPSIYGRRLATDTGAVLVFYGNSFPVDAGDANLKRIQINLEVKEWRNTQ